MLTTSQVQPQLRKLISFILLTFMLSVSILPAFGQGSIYTVGSGNCVTPPTGLVAWWPGNGNAEDIQNGHDGLTQNITYPNDYFDINRQSFAFNGVNSSIKVDAHPGLNVGTGDFTIELWVKPQDVDRAQPLVEWNSNTPDVNGHKWGVHLWLNVYSQGSIYANLYDGNNRIISSAPLVQARVWQHIALTFRRNSGDMELFYNGSSAGIVNASAQITPFTGDGYDLYLGFRPPPEQTTYYEGRMDEVSIYNRALKESEISAIYNAQNAGKCHYTISGRTTDPCNINPMSDVLVLLNTSHFMTRTRVTDEDGFYSFDAAAKGNFTLRAVAGDTPIGEGFNPTSYTFNNLNGNKTANFQYHFNWPAECRP